MEGVGALSDACWL